MALIDGFIAGTSETRKALLSETHPVYQRYQRQWNLGLDAYDGAGGFLDGANLWPFPRENETQLVARRKQARYHNYAETLVDIYVRSITTGIERETTDEGLRDWWDDVDGQGTTIDVFLARALGQALAGAHAGILVDVTTGETTGPSVADETRRVTLNTFLSTSILDWRQGAQGLAGVKLKEDGPVTALSEKQASADHFLLWDREEWIRFDAEGNLKDTDTHDVGVVPLVVLRPKPSQRHPFIGKPLVDPSVVQALYNRASEEDLVLRDQAFSLFVIELPNDTTPDDFQKAQDQINAGVGTGVALVTKGTTNYKTADMQVPKTIRETQAMLVQELFRMAHLRFQRDTLETESAEAIRLQRQDLDQSLKAIAEEMQRAEEQLAWLYFAWTTPDADAAFDRAGVSVVYPQEFSIVSIEQELAGFAAALSMQLGSTAQAELKKRVVRIVLPDLDEDTMTAVEEEIAAAGTGLGAPSAERRQEATDRLRNLGVEVEEAEEAVA